MLLGCLSSAEAEKFVRVDGKMELAKYREIVEENLVDGAKALFWVDVHLPAGESETKLYEKRL